MDGWMDGCVQRGFVGAAMTSSSTFIMLLYGNK